MSAYSTVEVSREHAIAFLVGKIYQASNEQLGDMMDVYGDDGEPYYLNNFLVVNELKEEL